VLKLDKPILPLKMSQDFLENFLVCKAEAESGLAPAYDENAAGRKIRSKYVYFFGENSMNI